MDKNLSLAILVLLFPQFVSGQTFSVLEIRGEASIKHPGEEFSQEIKMDCRISFVDSLELGPHSVLKLINDSSDQVYVFEGASRFLLHDSIEKKRKRVWSVLYRLIVSQYDDLQVQFPGRMRWEGQGWVSRGGVSDSTSMFSDSAIWALYGVINKTVDVEEFVDPLIGIHSNEPEKESIRLSITNDSDRTYFYHIVKYKKDLGIIVDCMPDIPVGLKISPPHSTLDLEEVIIHIRADDQLYLVASESPITFTFGPKMNIDPFPIHRDFLKAGFVIQEVGL